MRYDSKSQTDFIATIGILFLLSTSSVDAGIITVGDVNPDPTSAGDADITGLGIFVVGDTANGSVTVNGGSQLKSGQSTPPPPAPSVPVASSVGRAPGVEGSVTVEGAGSKWVNNGFLLVGEQGKGSVTVKDGGTIESDGSHVGLEPGALGTVTVDNGSWIARNGLTVGTFGNGKLDVRNGGTVDIPASCCDSGNLNFGINPGGYGEGLITGGGSRVSVAFGTSVRRGTLTVENGALLEGLFLNVARDGGTASMTIDNATARYTGFDPVSGGAFVTVGRDGGGTGTLDIKNHSKLIIEDSPSGFGAGFQAGRNEGSDGTITVSDSEVSVTSKSLSVSIGRAGKGVLNIVDGAKVSVTSTDGAGRVRIGSEPTGNGEVLVSGAGSLLSVNNVTEGIEVGPVSTGKLTVADGATVQTNKIQVGTQGTLAGNGTIVGDVVNMGGTIAPGLSPGVMTIDGSLLGDPGSVFDFEIGGTGPGEFDQILVSGVAELANAIFNITFVDDFVAAAGDMFDLISAGQGSTFQIAQVNFFGASADAFVLSDDGAVLTLAAVPEPSTLMLMVIALVGLAWVGRRRMKVY